jgi:uncharacterized membrane protein YkoI
MGARTRGLLATMVVVFVVGGVGLASARFATDAERLAEIEFTRAHRDEARLGPARAGEIALQGRPGDVVQTYLEEDEGGGLVWEVLVRSEGDLWEIDVDAQTGAVLEEEMEGVEAEEGG